MSREIAQSIARNTGVMMVSQVITWTSSFVLMLFLPRYLGSEEYGRLYLAISIAMIAQMVIEYGGPYFLAKEVSRSRDGAPRLLSDTVGIRVLMWVIAGTALVGFSFAAGYPGPVLALIVILIVAKVWECAGKALSGCFQGFELMQYPALGGIAERFCVALVGVAALLMGAHAVVIALVMALSSLLNFGILAAFARRIVARIPWPRWGSMRELLKTNLPYFLWSLFGVVYYRIDAVMLSLMVPGVVVGWYGAAYRFFDVLMFLPSIFSTAVLPVLSRLSVGDTKSLARTTRNSIDFILLAAMPICVFVFFSSHEIIDLFFGSEGYGQAEVLLKIFAPGLVLVSIDSILASTLIASNLQRQWAGAAFVAMLFNPLANVFLIPFAQSHFGNGGIGAAIATLMTEFLVMCIAIYLTPGEIFEGASIGLPLKGLAASLVMSCFCWIFERSGVHFLLWGGAGLLLYGVSLILFGAIRRTDLAFVKYSLIPGKWKNTSAATRGVPS
ncbi:MAG TPA: flippase [Bacteroidota bacterium]|jgi:O-antigen/teichoic acid export membrane protein